jgi:hypothetical protein
MNFWWDGKHIQRSTKHTNLRKAERAEREYHNKLADATFGIEERTPAPSLEEFAERFRQAIDVRCADKPETVRFYNSKPVSRGVRASIREARRAQCR